jgi:cysteine synthase A
MAGAIGRAEEFASQTERAFMPGQFANPSNPAAHYATTGPEIENALGGAPTVFVAGVGTGGTITGNGRYFKERDPGVRIVAVEPDTSPVLTNAVTGSQLPVGPHTIQGIGAGFVPPILDLSLLDAVERVKDEEAYAMARRLAAEEGLLVGISSGANVVAALREAERLCPGAGPVVTVAPSTGERYLSTPLFSIQQDVS